jgi:hypothetical protein
MSKKKGIVGKKKKSEWMAQQSDEKKSLGKRRR